MVLYSSALVLKYFRKLFLSQIITLKLNAGLLLYVLLCICPLTFKTKLLYLSSSHFVASTASL